MPRAGSASSSFVPAALNELGESGATARRRIGVSRAGVLLQACERRRRCPAISRLLDVLRAPATGVPTWSQAHVGRAHQAAGHPPCVALHEYLRGRPLTRAATLLASAPTYRRESTVCGATPRWGGARPSLAYPQPVDPGRLFTRGHRSFGGAVGLPPIRMVRIGLVSTFAAGRAPRVSTDRPLSRPLSAQTSRLPCTRPR